MKTYRPYQSSVILFLLIILVTLLSLQFKGILLYIGLAFIIMLYYLFFSIIKTSITITNDCIKTTMPIQKEVLDCTLKDKKTNHFLFRDIANLNYLQDKSKLAMIITLHDSSTFYVSLTLLSGNQKQEIINFIEERNK